MAKKENLIDFTFLIIVRLDSIARLENVVLCTDFLNKNFRTNINVLESAPYNSGLLKKLLNRGIKYTFLEDNDVIFYRTRLLNKMSKTVHTEYISVWDADVIIPTQQIIKSVNLLRIEKVDFVYPYEKKFLDTSSILRKLFITEGNLELLERNSSKMQEKYLPAPVGGAFLANMNSYVDAGLENEQFYGWGLEDGERYYRWENKGYKIKRVPGPLFHLSHERGVNSSLHNVAQVSIKRKLTNEAKMGKITDCIPQKNNK